MILPDGTVERPALGSGDPVDAFAARADAWPSTRSRRGTTPAALSAELARQALALCQAEVESVKTGKSVALD